MSRTAQIQLLFGLLLVGLSGCFPIDYRPPAEGDVGNAGGTVAVTSGALAGTSIVIPQGALPRTIGIEIDHQPATVVPDALLVSPGAAEFRPYGLKFRTPATLTLPFDAGRVPAGTSSGDFVVKRRDIQGRVVEIVPATVDPVAGTVTASISSLASFWVAVIVDQGRIALADYLPLGSSGRYEFDNDLTIHVSQSQTRPNLGGVPVSVMAVVGDLVNEGVYLDRNGAMTVSLGRFARFASYQEVQSGSLVFLPPVGRLGASTSSRGGYVGYEPWGTSVSAYTGTETLVVEIASQGSLRTLVGQFEDVLEIAFTSQRADSRPSSQTVVDRLWLARDVGPVQIELQDLGPVGRAKRVVVGGVLITR